MPNDNANGGGTSDGGFDINEVLGTTPQGGESTEQVESQESAQGAQQSGGQAFKFANRSWGSQADAEKHFNKIYGQFSEHQGLVNKLKQAFQRDPESIQALAQDPEWAEILEKMGIEAASGNANQKLQESQAQSPRDFQQFQQQFEVKSAQFDLKMEKFDFEQSLGRKLGKDEENAILDIIEKSPSLSYHQAYKLAFHDKLLKEAAMKAQKPLSNPRGNRPPPPPGLTAGVKLNLKKPISEMSKDEAREAMRNDVREMLGRGA
jgi:hypothetical protein